MVFSKLKMGFWSRLKDALTFKPRPIAVTQIEVTTHCPHACVYCPRTNLRQQWTAQHMSLDTFTRLWPLLRISDRVHLQGWGEPLAHPHFLSMVALAREAGCQVSSTTSGQYLTPDLAHALVHSGLDVLAFSVAGATAATHDQWRVGIAFEQVLQSIALVQELRHQALAMHLEIHLAYLLLASHLQDLQYLPKLMRTLNIHGTIVSILDPTLAPDLKKECFTAHEQEKNTQARQILAKIAAQVRENGAELYYALPQTQDRGRCFERADQGVFVDTQGNLAPCVHLNLPLEQKQKRTRIFGSCWTENPVDIWHSQEFVQFRTALKTTHPDLACESCIKRFL